MRAATGYTPPRELDFVHTSYSPSRLSFVAALLVSCGEAATPPPPPSTAVVAPVPTTTPPASTAAPVSVVRAAPLACTAEGEPIELATMDGRHDVEASSITLGPALAAVVAHVGSAYSLFLADPGGHLVAGPIALGDPGEMDVDFDVRVEGTGFRVVYVDHRDSRPSGPIDLVAREVSASGVLGPKVVLVRSLQYGISDARERLWDGDTLVVVEADADDRGTTPGTITVHRGLPTAELAQTARWSFDFPDEPPSDEDLDTPASTSLFVPSTPSGVVVGWRASAGGHTRVMEQRLDAEGRVTGEAAEIPIGPGAVVDRSASGWYVSRVVDGRLETAPAPITDRAVWVPIPTPWPVLEPGRVVVELGREWALLRDPSCGVAPMRCSSWWRVPLDAQHAPLGAAWTLPVAALAVADDGRAAGVSSAGHSLRLHVLRCP